MAAAPGQQANEAIDAACGLLRMQLQPATRQCLHINALPRFDAEMGPPPSGKLSPVLLTTRGLKEMTSAALQRGCQS